MIVFCMILMSFFVVSCFGTSSVYDLYIEVFASQIFGHTLTYISTKILMVKLS